MLFCISLNILLLFSSFVFNTDSCVDLSVRREYIVSRYMDYVESHGFSRHEMPALPSMKRMISIEPTVYSVAQGKCSSLNRISLS